MKLTIPEPCHADWATMSGDERKRFCGACKKHVHDLSELTEAEATTLLKEPGTCTRFRTDAAGEVIFADTPMLQVLARQAAALAITATMVSTPALAGGMQASGADEPGWGDWLVEWIANGGPFAWSEPLVGEPAIPPPLPPPEMELPLMGAPRALERAVEVRTLDNATSVDLEVRCAFTTDRVEPGGTLTFEAEEGRACQVVPADGRPAVQMTEASGICTDTEPGRVHCG